ncbi:hypothetical protein M434DRAFT_28384 [Hypoxylon sp. CO27-5]|nr:hypothetical protein M434DRAFT_28384 [Hypoxylon sp. CO27-5]
MITAARLLSSIVVCLTRGAAVDDSDGFSNNLPRYTDLGPLLTLSGERVTMQFMSQAMGWADNIILAMAPIGIITAMVAAIRVSGPSWLKTVIGRAREGRGITEAELMSSTSCDVGELWDGHEIVRVMGEGPIREFIIISPTKDSERLSPASEDQSISNTDVDCEQDMKVMQLTGPDQKYLVDDKSASRGDDPKNGGGNSDHSTIIIRNTTVSSPNLTLNVYNHLNRRELHVVATIGTILQLSVIIYFWYITYGSGLRFLKDRAPAAAYAFPCSAGGTLLLVAGMMICSYVVEASTVKTMYRPLEGKEARVVWLQRSGIVNDQAFDAIAIYPSNPLDVVTTSQRRDVQGQGGWLAERISESSQLTRKIIFGFSKIANTPEEAMAVIGPVLCFGGFILQTIGFLRMHWSASVAQLGASLVMISVRVWVCRRLAGLPTSQRLLSGFELDWLALALSNPSKAPWLGEVGNGKSDQNSSQVDIGSNWIISSIQHDADLLELESLSGSAGPRTTTGPAEGTNSAGQKSKAHQTMRIRRELGRLADWHGPASTEAVCLARAIEVVMDTFFDDVREDLDLRWSLPVDKEMVYFRLEKKGAETWKAFADELEAALSLWLYSLNDIERINRERRVDNKSDITAKAEDDDSWLRADEGIDKRSLRVLGPDSQWLRRDLSWWMPNNAPRLFELEEDGKDGENIEGDIVKVTITDIEKKESTRTIEMKKHRMVGVKIGSKKGLVVASHGPLKRLLAQHMFSVFMWAAVKKSKALRNSKETKFGGVEVRPRDTSSPTWQSLSLHNTRFSNFAQDIYNTGIASLDEVFLSIIPPLSYWKELPGLDAIVRLTKQHARLHAKSGHWEQTTDAYLWLFDMSINTNIVSRATALLVEHLGAIKAAIKLREGQLFHALDIKHLKDLELRVHKRLEDPELSSEIRDIRPLVDTLYDMQRDSLRKADKFIEDTNEKLRFTDLHFVAFYSDESEIEDEAKKGDINSEDVLGWRPLHYAVLQVDELPTQVLLQNGADVNAQNIRGLAPLHVACWNKYSCKSVHQLLQYPADINMRDDDGRAPLHHAAESGNWKAARILVEAGADVNLIDNLGHTPLFSAAYEGHLKLTDILWSEEHKKTRDRNFRTPLHLAAMIKPEGKLGREKREEKELRKWDSLLSPDIVIERLLKERVTGKQDNAEENLTLLRSAKKEYDDNVVKLLFEVEGGIDLKAKDDSGETLLFAAVKRRSQAEAQLLLDYGADIEAKSENDETPLFKAVRKGYKDQVQLLLDRGAHAEARNKKGLTPLQLAEELSGKRAGDEWLGNQQEDTIRVLKAPRPPASS